MKSISEISTVQLRAQLSAACREYLTACEDDEQNRYICPCCKAGASADDPDGLYVMADAQHWECSACGARGDVFDLMGKVLQLESFSEQKQAVASLAGFEVADSSAAAAPAVPPAVTAQVVMAPSVLPPAVIPTAGALPAALPPSAANDGRGPAVSAAGDYSTYYKSCRARLKQDARVRTCLEDLGLGVQTAACFDLGFDPQADAIAAPGGCGQLRQGRPCLIVPLGADCYVACSLVVGSDTLQTALCAGTTAVPLFNAAELERDDERPIFSTAGVMDALSLAECGFRALALNDAANVDQLLTRLQTYRSDVPLLLALGNDHESQQAASRLYEGLVALKIRAVMAADICGRHRDPGARLRCDRTGLERAAQLAVLRPQARPHAWSAYVSGLMDCDLRSLPAPVSTGFAQLDRASGGLHAGLYILAAASGLGKTTLLLQIAAQVAAGGSEVLYFSLEQSKAELVSKCLARYAALDNPASDITSQAIRYRRADSQLVKRAVARATQDLEDRLSIIDTDDMVSMQHLTEYIRGHVRRTQTRPVVMVDYLQLLRMQAAADRNIRVEVDDVVTTMRQLSRELGLCVMMISSINRSSYLRPVDFESIKESGGIEYTADVVWGLHLQCMCRADFMDKRTSDAARRQWVQLSRSEVPRHLELVGLKNRYGRSYFTVAFNYYPAQDRFEEGGEFQE